MPERTPPIDDIIHAWTEAEQDVWSTWSGVEQDLSSSEANQGCGRVLDALEVSALEVAKLQSVAARGACATLAANPLLPPQARTWVSQACKPLLGVSSLQQHLISAWFGMARQIVVR